MKKDEKSLLMGDFNAAFTEAGMAMNINLGFEQRTYLLWELPESILYKLWSNKLLKGFESALTTETGRSYFHKLKVTVLKV